MLRVLLLKMMVRFVVAVAATCAAPSAIVVASVVVVSAIDTCALPVRAP